MAGRILPWKIIKAALYASPNGYASLSKFFIRTFCLIIAVASLSACQSGGEILLAEDFNFTNREDGKLVFSKLEENGDRSLSLFDIETGKTATFFSLKGKQLSSPSASNDGEKIVFSIWEQKNPWVSQIGLVNADGSGFVTLTKGEEFCSHPFFSPDNTHVIYLSAKGNPGNTRVTLRRAITIYDLYRQELSSGKITQLTHLRAYWINSPSYSDNQEIVFSYPQEGKGMVISALNTKSMEVSNKDVGMEDIYEVSATHSNHKIAFVAESGLHKGYFTYDIFMVQDDEVRRITDLNSDVGNLKISKDGRQMIFLKKAIKADQKGYVLLDIDTFNMKPISVGKRK